MKDTISVVIITKNEERNIRECLESVKWADEIIVVDDCSTDNTVRICQNYTDKIYLRKLQGFGEQKQFGLEQASSDWVLFLDADERVTPQLKEEIQDVLQISPNYDGFYIYKKVFYLGKWIRYSNWYLPVLVLARRNKAGCDLRKVHESIIVKGKIGYLRNHILHYAYRSISQHIEKLNLYTTLEAQVLFAKGIRITSYNKIYFFLFKPLFIFLRKFIFHKGILDGVEGFFISVFSSIGTFLIYAKLWELQRNEKNF